MITDPFSHVLDSVTGPFQSAAAVTPSDTVDLSTRPRALLATTTAGTVVVRMKDSSTSVTLYLELGIPLAVRVDRVLTGGTAGGIVALW